MQIARHHNVSTSFWIQCPIKAILVSFHEISNNLCNLKHCLPTSMYRKKVTYYLLLDWLLPKTNFMVGC